MRHQEYPSPRAVRHPSRLAYDTPREPFRGFWPDEIPRAGAWARMITGEWRRLGDAATTAIKLSPGEVVAGALVTKPSEARDAVSWG